MKSCQDRRRLETLPRTLDRLGTRVGGLLDSLQH